MTRELHRFHTCTFKNYIGKFSNYNADNTAVSKSELFAAFFPHSQPTFQQHAHSNYETSSSYAADNGTVMAEINGWAMVNFVDEKVVSSC